jgi:hypothetical protein
LRSPATVGNHDAAPRPDPIALQTACVGPAELVYVQDAPVLHVDPQCARMPDRAVAWGYSLVWRSRLRPAVGPSDETDRAREPVQAGRRRISASRVRPHPATPSCDGDPCRTSGSIRRHLMCQGPLLGPSGRARGGLWSDCVHADTSMRGPSADGSPHHARSVFRREVVGALRRTGGAASLAASWHRRPARGCW